MSEDATMEELESKVKSSRHVDKRQKWILFWLVGVVTALSIGLLALYLDTRGQAEASAEVAVEAQQEKVEVASEARQAICGDQDQEIYDRELCEKLAGIAEEDPLPPVDSPAVVIGGPSQAEIVQGFREYCAEGNCRGPEGAEPTPEDIADAFARFCADGRCTGPAGADGEPGSDAPPVKDGADGVDGVNGADGADAPPPSLDLMLAAVTSYCADGRCVGPQGAEGPPPTEEALTASVAAYCSSGACTGSEGPAGPSGPAGADSTVPGPQGVSIVDVDCIGSGADSSWQITLSDGQILNGGGPCQAALNSAPSIPGGP